MPLAAQLDQLAMVFCVDPEAPALVRAPHQDRAHRTAGYIAGALLHALDVLTGGLDGGGAGHPLVVCADRVLARACHDVGRVLRRVAVPDAGAHRGDRLHADPGGVDDHAHAGLRLAERRLHAAPRLGEVALLARRGDLRCLGEHRHRLAVLAARRVALGRVGLVDAEGVEVRARVVGLHDVGRVRRGDVVLEFAHPPGVPVVERLDVRNVLLRHAIARGEPCDDRLELGELALHVANRLHREVVIRRGDPLEPVIHPGELLGDGLERCRGRREVLLHRGVECGVGRLRLRVATLLRQSDRREPRDLVEVLEVETGEFGRLGDREVVHERAGERLGRLHLGIRERLVRGLSDRLLERVAHQRLQGGPRVRVGGAVGDLEFVEVVDVVRTDLRHRRLSCDAGIDQRLGVGRQCLDLRCARRVVLGGVLRGEHAAARVERAAAHRRLRGVVGDERIDVGFVHVVLGGEGRCRLLLRRATREHRHQECQHQQG